MAKQAKKIQTDYTRGGHDISQTAVPLYQSNLNRMDDYLSDPNAYRQDIIDRYYGADSARNQDFLRAYQRAMGNTTANNWAATTGGYTSSGDRAYTDRQRYYNDLASRLQDYGVTSAANIANADYNNMLNANTAYHDAYGLGKEYSDIEQYNNMADQANRSWWAQGLGTLGKAIGAIPTPVTAAIGAAMAGVGDAFTVNMPSVSTNNTLGQQANAGAGGIFTNMNSVLSNADWGNLWADTNNWWNKNITNRGLNYARTDAAGNNYFNAGAGTPEIRGKR